MKAVIEPVVGRYAHVEIQGAAHRIYFEEAGQGAPVLCLHTAGADNRQWRFVLNDHELTSARRFIAFDMPWHGKSLPPEGWQTQEYLLLDTETPTWIPMLSFSRRHSGLDRARSYAGCSMGGRIALQLALAPCATSFSGFIAIEASDFQPAWYDIDWFHRPDAPGGEMGAALVSANIAPYAPEMPSAGTPSGCSCNRGPVFFVEISVSTPATRALSVKLAQDRYRRLAPVHIMVGEYDLTCTPDDARRTADGDSRRDARYHARDRPLSR